MSYADATFYTDEFKGTTIPIGQLATQLQRASDSVDIVTRFRVPATNLTVFQTKMLKMATCFQAEHLYTYGDAITAGLQSYSVGDVSVTMPQATDLRYSRQMLEYLSPTGLMNRLL